MSNQPQSSCSTQASSESSNRPASSATFERKANVELDMQTHPDESHPHYITVVPSDASGGPLNDAGGNLSNANPDPDGSYGLRVEGKILAAATKAHGQKLRMGDKVILTYFASNRRLLKVRVEE